MLHTLGEIASEKVLLRCKGRLSRLALPRLRERFIVDVRSLSLNKFAEDNVEVVGCDPKSRGGS